MSLQDHKEPAPKQQTVIDRAVQAAMKYTDLPLAAARNKIREEVPCSKTTAFKAYKKAKAMKQKEEHPQETAPEIRIVEEKPKTPEFLEEPEKPEKLEGLEEIEGVPAAQKLLTEGELTAEDMSFLFEAANDGIRMFSEKHAPSDKSAKMLGKLWYRPFNKWWATISEENPLLAIAILVTIIIYLPAFIGGIMDWRKEQAQKKEQKKKEIEQ